jgi:hypothetical protein
MSKGISRNLKGVLTMINDTLIVILATREEIENQDLSRIEPLLNSLLKSPLDFYGSVDIVVDGYDNDPRELWEIPEVRSWFQVLDKRWPYWFYFSCTETAGLCTVMLCCVKTEKVDATHLRVSPLDAAVFFAEHFVPMNDIFEKTGQSIEENRRRTEMISDYFSRRLT